MVSKGSLPIFRLFPVGSIYQFSSLNPHWRRFCQQLRVGIGEDFGLNEVAKAGNKHEI
jgi:hypothetical protein